MIHTFTLAPMSPLIRRLTVALIAIPVVFILLPLFYGGSTFLSGFGLALAGLFGAIWIWWRPKRFDVSPDGVHIIFPGRRRVVALQEVEGCRTTTKEDFRQEFGHAIRIGAGGLWGGFGWLWTSRRGLIDFYVSRADGLVLLERRGARTILITPENPQGMVEAVRALS
jgi:hypothetical protein